MGLLTGYISLILLILLLAKYVTKRCHLTKINAFLMKIHKYAAGGFLVVSILHLILVLPVFDTRAVIVSVSGIVIIVVGILLTISCHTIKNKKVEIKFHRLFSMIILLMLITHMVFYFIDFKNYLTAMDNISVSEVDLNTIENGEYIGEYDAGYIYANDRYHARASDSRISVYIAGKIRACRGTGILFP